MEPRVVVAAPDGDRDPVPAGRHGRVGGPAGAHALQGLVVGLPQVVQGELAIVQGREDALGATGGGRAPGDAGAHHAEVLGGAGVVEDDGGVGAGDEELVRGDLGEADDGGGGAAVQRDAAPVVAKVDLK